MLDNMERRSEGEQQELCAIFVSVKRNVKPFFISLYLISDSHGEAIKSKLSVGTKKDKCLNLLKKCNTLLFEKWTHENEAFHFSEQ